MIKYYHGSRNADLKTLCIEKPRRNYVYLTPQYEFALMYAGNSLRFWNFNFETNKLIIREVAPNSLEKLYKGKTCYIYSATEVGEFERADCNGRKAIKMKHNVDLTFEEVVPDAYEKIMQLYNQGEIEIWF